ncbi:MAG: transposase, partial [Acidobacteriaceae bacterium]
RHFQQCGQLHFITFSCYRRRAKLASPASRAIFETALERMRRKYDFLVCGYVVMPEHVHLLLSEPERGTLATALQGIKQAVSRRLGSGEDEAFWQARYYDFNVFSEGKRIEKLRYMHRNPVKRGLVQRPEEWDWSSFRHYLSGAEGNVEVESMWTAAKRERAGVALTVKVKAPARFSFSCYAQ